MVNSKPTEASSQLKYNLKKQQQNINLKNILQPLFMDQQQKVLNEPGQLPNLNRTEPAFHFKDTQVTLCSDSLKWKRLCMETAVISRYVSQNRCKYSRIKTDASAF